MHVGRALALALTIALWVAGQSSAQQELTVVGTRPAGRSLAARTGTSITVEFDRPVRRSSVTPSSFWAFGRWSGAASGSFSFEDGDRVVVLNPTRRFSAGETVMVVLSRDLEAVDGSPLRSSGYSYHFWTRSLGSGFTFTETDRFSTRSSPSVTTRSYGGFGSDLDGDGLLDLTIVNEDTNDLRTFMNLGAAGMSDDFLDPPASVGDVPSPSEPTDFDRDGDVDVVVANTQGGSVSILLGNGDGTFGAPQTVDVGGEPRGVAVLDADGDGDIDVAATSFIDGTVTVLLNDGTGLFGSPSSFGTGAGERAIAAADMNNDGVLDLVVGTLIGQEILVYTGDGDGSYTLAGRQPSGGESWMLVLGDLNGDRAEDVAVVNSDSDNGAILFGDGGGGLAPPQVLPTDPFPLAADLADLDGDGDLDWVTSSFFGDWMAFENDGTGSFSLVESYDAPQAASCSIPMDLDNDGVLDLVLIDELEDEVILMAGGARGFASGFESGDTSDWSRSRGAVEVVSPGLSGTDHALEVLVDGRRARSWVESRHPKKEPSFVASFVFQANGVDLGGERVEILRFASRRRQVVLSLEGAGGGYRVYLEAGDGGGLREIGSVAVPASREVRLGVEWSSASSATSGDGRVVLSKDGRVRASAFDLDNHGEVVNKVQLGLPSGSAGASGGAFLVDEYASSP
jgi:hypothetical protein